MNVYGSQQPTAPASKKVQVSEAFLIEAEKAIAEKESLERQLAIERERLAVAEQEKNALRALLDIERLRADNLFKAVAEHRAASAIDERLFENYQQRIDDYKVERARLIAERDKAISSRTKWTIGGVIFGIAVGAISQR